ncbi:MAG: SRPBCC family protein [Solirubrobacterales bacterium]|nr:SRPBCC family protein [Solirubrobacterales bacterium]
MIKHINGTHRAAIAPEALWAALSDPERLGAALPDVRWVTADGPDVFRAGVRPSTNLGVTPLELDVRIAERDEPRRVRITGDGSGGEFRVAFDTELQLAGADDGACDVTWSAQVQAFGVLASLTQRVLPWLLRDQITLVLRTAEAQASQAAGGVA